MKFKTNKKEFIEAIGISARAISAKQNMPILSGIYLNANNNILELQATDYELGFIIRIEAEVAEEGEVILSGKYLTEISKKLPGDVVEFEYNASEKVAHISSERSNYRLLSMEGDFPKIDRVDDNISINIKDNDFINMIRKTTFAAATDEIRPIFTGCFFDITEDTLTMVATNTHRLALNKMTVDNSGNNIRAIIPAKALNELSYAAKEDEPSDITVTYANNQVGFQFRNIYMVTRLIEGEYPDYRRVIPTEHKTIVTVDRGALASAVDRVSLISRYHEFHMINFKIEQDSIHILSINSEIGKAEEDVATETEGEELSISFNVQYIVDVLKTIDGSKIKFSFNGELGSVKVEDLENKDFIYVLTPVRNQM